MRLLLVEDEVDLAGAVKASLSSAGYAVDVAHSLAEVADYVAVAQYELILLDRRLPDGDGLEAIPALRRRLPDVRIIVLTALDATGDKVSGLDAGADDYLTKPFQTDELLARIRAILRRPGGSLQPLVQCGDIAYDPNQRNFLLRGEALVLKRREHLVLEALMMRARRVVQRDTFFAQAYDLSEDIQSNTLDAHISRLRAKFEELKAGAVIHTVRGVGYMLTDGGRL